MNLCKTCGTICPFDDEHEECEHYKPMTNEDWLRSCNTEQLADVLADVSLWIHPFMKQKNRFELLKKQFYEWLKQPHTNKE